MSKLQKVGGRGGHVEFVARVLLRLVEETGGYEGGGVGIVGFVEVDGIKGTAMKVPLGTYVPSENVKGSRKMRAILTVWKNGGELLFVARRV